MSFTMSSTSGNSDRMGNSTIRTNSTALSQSSYINNNATFTVIEQLKTLDITSERQPTVILASFNIVIAAATAAGILYDSYLRAKRSPLRKHGRVNCFSCVRGADVYPFLVSLSVVGQGIIFIAAQVQGLGMIFKIGCALISEFMLPAIFFVPYVQLIFALETTSRALKKQPFTPRSRWTVPTCLIFVNLALIITGLIAFVVRPPNICFASLFWFVARWAEGGFILLLILVVILTSCATIIYLQLRRQPTIRQGDRVGASRLFYYIVLAIFPNILMMPFFAYLSFNTDSRSNPAVGLTFSEIASITANISGLLHGGLYLFLRSNIIPTIMPKGKFDDSEIEDLKNQRMYPGSTGADFNSQIAKPISAPRYPIELDSRQKTPPAQENPVSIHPLRLQGVFDEESVSKSLEPVKVPSSKLHARKPSASSSYALFPNRHQGNTASATLLPSLAYSPTSREQVSGSFVDTSKPRPAFRFPMSHHRRDSSWVSSATVQIGLRLSNMEDVPPIARNFATENDEVHGLDCPEASKAMTSNRPSPLVTTTTEDIIPQPPRSKFSPEASPLSMIKNLPPLPRNPEQVIERSPVLNPTVYKSSSPIRTKVPSPRGVGVNVLKKSNTGPIQPSGAVASPSCDRGDSDVGENREEWI
ncbi:hypothetical protein F5Y16DRAFT_47527 [Xylariaceae sp. FL0255]|nr:hypothetical protein F5Y16DRAFT_47527 [Xylariaceae sp. FL0255]